MRRLEYSIVAEFTALPHDIRDIDYWSNQVPLGITISEPGDHDYIYLAVEEELPNHTPTDPDQPCLDCPIREEDSCPFWCQFAYKGQVLHASGILTQKEFDKWVSNLYLVADSTETMGTLGGPLAPWGGVVPDIVFQYESQTVIASIRVTPFVVDENREGVPIPWREMNNNDLLKAYLGQMTREQYMHRRAERFWIRLKKAICQKYQP